MIHEYDGKEYSIYLEDEGTLDTVLSIDGYHVRYSWDVASDYRDRETGELDLTAFLAEFGDDIVEEFLDAGEMELLRMGNKTMKTKRTPGPWHNHGGNITTSKDINACAEFIAQNVYKKEDARLIASSPDLLEAAKAGIALLRKLSDYGAFKDNGLPRMEACADVIKLLDAIGKAEKGE